MERLTPPNKRKQALIGCSAQLVFLVEIFHKECTGDFLWGMSGRKVQGDFGALFWGGVLRRKCYFFTGKGMEGCPEN